MLPHEFFKLMSDETRIRTLLWISAKGEVCVNDLVEVLQESQPKVSRHLAMLRQVGVVTDCRVGQRVFYRLSSGLPSWLYKTIQGLEQSNCLQSAYQLNFNEVVLSSGNESNFTLK
ncbi:metalloregulator ArsR/SmtB family transcription factor [Vibrio sp. 10N.261.51.F12]|uniref:metalloregulator ArsR/SmtB family transcription factor n=1 Tax=Vibrio sp. 10N.261.51.F12 TaxID=3229679 RepID=UPI00354ED8B3